MDVSDLERELETAVGKRAKRLRRAIEAERDRPDKCSFHKAEKLMPNGKCSLCVWTRFGHQLKEIIGQ